MSLQKLIVGPPDLTHVAEPIYANGVHVSSTPYDFRITFSILMAPHDAPGSVASTPSFVPQAVVDVVLPAGAVPSVIELLRAELEEFVSTYGGSEPSVRVE
jgi:hypothetical protein